MCKNVQKGTRDCLFVREGRPLSSQKHGKIRKREQYGKDTIIVVFVEVGEEVEGIKLKSSGSRTDAPLAGSS